MELYKNHRENAIKAQKLASKAAIQSKKKIQEDYYLNPNKCIECLCDLNFYKRKNKFCGSSCSAKHNNKIRGPHSNETKNKISKSLGGSEKLKSTINKYVKTCKSKYDLNPKKCKICNSTINYENRYRKTCSDECKIIACVKIRTYQNGSRKTLWYFNKNENKNVLLESSWELKFAQFLDEKNIFWVRPKHLIWFDKKNIKRYYFPDFYLTNYDLYVDPKNIYCLKKDEEKLKTIEKNINIIYGDINEIIDKIKKLINISTLQKF